MPDIVSTIDIESEEFLKKKREFFASKARSLVSVLVLHKDHLWEANKCGPRDRDNVTKHCLVEVARVETLASMVGLSPSMTQSLKKAAMLHDLFKKDEKNIVTNKDKYPVPTWEAFDESKRHEDLLINKFKEEERYWLDDEIVYLMWSIWHTSLIDTKNILLKSQKEELTDLEKAFLILHYVDDFTRDDKRAEKAQQDWESLINDFDLRMRQNNDHPRYQQLNEDGVKIFWQKTFDEQSEVGHQVENYIYTLINKRNNTVLVGQSSKDIPYFIDQIIKNNINKF